MMDFTDITTAVKKTTKKAANLAMKPVNMVADPVIEANNKLKKSVFWPDMVMLETLKQKQQHKLFHANYLAHIEDIAKVLKGKKIAVKKLNAYIQATKLIEAAPEKGISLEDKVDQIQELFDELRTSCKQGIPTKLKENVFSVDKKNTYTTDEFSLISDQIAATKKFVNSLFNQLESDMVPLFLTHKPDATKLLLEAQDKRTHLVDAQKTYQDSVFAYSDEINSWRSLVRAIVDSCDRLRKYDGKSNSLFWPEKTKYKTAQDDDMKKLKELVSKDFVARQKKLAKQATETAKKQSAQEKVLPDVQANWSTFFWTWKTRRTSIQTTTATTQKNYGKILTTLQKTLTTGQKNLQDLQTKTYKQLTEPYTQHDLFVKQRTAIQTAHDTVHDEYLALADHHCTTGMHGELPVCSDVRLVDQRVEYLNEEMNILRQQILYTKLIKRVWNNMADTVKSFENRIDDRKIYAKEVLVAPLKQLRTLTTTLQEQVKVLEKQVKSYEDMLAKGKTELWDSISFRRLTDLKRTRHQDNQWATLWLIHSKALSWEIKTQTERSKSLESLEKAIQKKQNIDRTALDEQQKTVSLVKTKEQKDKLNRLEQQVNAQELLQKDIHEEKETTKTHTTETSVLQKKYEYFWKDHQAHAQRYKKFIDEVSKKLSKSPLNQWVDCSNKLVSMFS